MIRAKGFSAERFMNLVAYRGVYLWDVVQVGAGMTMKAAGGSLDILQTCAEKTGCSLEVLGYGGLPAFLRRFSGKSVWTAGMLLFAVGLYLLSSFVWVIEVEGNVRLSEDEILTACREMGLRPGTWKGSVDTDAITDALLARFSDISWVSVGMDGTDAIIRLAETIEQAEMVDKTTPCDIIAAADGVILQITAERGTPLVSPGDVVKKGDVLISCELVIGLEGEAQHTELVAAEGAVTARIWQSLAEDAPLAYEQMRYTGEERENHSLILSGQEWDFVRPSGEKQWERTPLWEKPLAIGDFALPLTWKKESWKAYEMEPKSRTPEEAKAFLEENLRKKAENLLSPYGTIEDIAIRYTEYADHVHAEAELTLAERIEQKQVRNDETGASE